MTTFVDPLGITATIEAKTGIVSISASSTPTAIPYDCGWMVAVVASTTGGPAVSLPSGAALGTMVEVHHTSSAFGANLNVLAPTSETINGDSAAQVTVGSGRIFRKRDTSVWSAVGT